MTVDPPHLYSGKKRALSLVPITSYMCCDKNSTMSQSDGIPNPTGLNPSACMPKKEHIVMGKKKKKKKKKLNIISHVPLKQCLIGASLAK